MPRQFITRLCILCGVIFLSSARRPAKYCSRACWVARQTQGKSTEERFWSFVDKTASCWLWTGYLKESGYGRFSINGKPIAAHKFSYQLNVGPIPNGMLVCHNCPGGDNPACVNPDHLWLGTNADNMNDMYAKGRRQFR